MANQSFNARSGLSLLTVILGLVLLVIGGVFLVAFIAKSREMDHRIQCSKNLRQIGTAFFLYAGDNNGNFPRTRYDATSGKLTAYTGAGGADPFDKNGGPDINDVTAPFYLLIRSGNVNRAAFVCPSTDAVPMDQGTHSNFPDNRYLSYSMHNPYFNPAAIDSGARWTNTINSSFAIAADMNPGGATLKTLSPTSPPQLLKQGNSTNHGGSGQNVLFGDGHVEFTLTPFCGVEGDNIYTPGYSGKGAEYYKMEAANGPHDSVLLPTAGEGMPSAR